MNSVCFRWKYSLSQHHQTRLNYNEMWLRCTNSSKANKIWFSHDPLFSDAANQTQNTIICILASHEIKKSCLGFCSFRHKHKIHTEAFLHVALCTPKVSYVIQCIVCNWTKKKKKDSSSKILKLSVQLRAPIAPSVAHTQRVEKIISMQPFIAILRFSAIHFKWKPRLIISA